LKNCGIKVIFDRFTEHFRAPAHDRVREGSVVWVLKRK